MKLVLLPGLDGTGLLFKPLLEILPEHIEPIVISYPSNLRLNYQKLTEYILERLPDENFILLCESFSGPAAYQVALKNPDNLKAIIFVATFLGNPRPILLGLSGCIPRQLLLSLPVPNSFIKLFMLGYDAADNILELVKSTIKSVPGKILSFRMKQISRLDTYNSLCNLKATYIQATNDRIVPRKCLDNFKTNFDNLNVVQINGPHLLLQTKPMACLKVIERIIRDL